MLRTTVYLPDELKRDLERAAEAQGRSEADIIREGIRLAIEKSVPPMPTLWTFSANDPDFIERIDELLDGFGEQ
ncbi:MAG: ribbon-helix-helix domain-containing protein [Chloroflexota bacterium]|nr:ribbon-helix-helix domain-containing protein [Chloroflexota bacterium]